MQYNSINWSSTLTVSLEQSCVLAFKSLCCHLAATIIIMAASSKKGKFHRRLDARIKNTPEKLSFLNMFVPAAAAAAASAGGVIT